MMQFATNLRIGILGQPDSETLWSEIISKIDIKPNMKFLNICSGHGTEAILLAKALVSSGHYTKQQALDAIWLVDKYSMFTNPLKLMGFTNVITTDFLEYNFDMKFDAVIGNPPYQAPKTSDKKGKGGNNSLYLDFIKKSLEISDIVAMITPPAGLIKSTVLGKSTSTLELMNGGLKHINLNAKEHFNVGTPICWWIYDKNHNGNVTIVSDDNSFDVTNITYLPPKVDLFEHSIFEKIANNRKGCPIVAKRESGDEVNDYWFARFGHNYTQKGREGTRCLSTDNEWITSNVAKFYLNYIKRHDAMTYHNMINGLYDGKIDFTTEELDHINKIADNEK